MFIHVINSNKNKILHDTYIPHIIIKMLDIVLIIILLFRAILDFIIGLCRTAIH